MSAEPRTLICSHSGRGDGDRDTGWRRDSPRVPGLGCLPANAGSTLFPATTRPAGTGGASEAAAGTVTAQPEARVRAEPPCSGRGGARSSRVLGRCPHLLRGSWGSSRPRPAPWRRTRGPCAPRARASPRPGQSNFRDRGGSGRSFPTSLSRMCAPRGQGVPHVRSGQLSVPTPAAPRPLPSPNPFASLQKEMTSKSFNILI